MKGFRIYLTLEGRDILSRDVTFDESIMYSTKSIKTSNLGKEQENLLQTNRVLEVHQSTIADLPRVQFINDDAENLASGTHEPEVTPTSHSLGKKVEQSNQGFI